MSGEDQNKQVPPPMDPYAVYQTPYERNKQEAPNPFIEFRRFADKQISLLLNGFATNRSELPANSGKVGEGSTETKSEVSTLRDWYGVDHSSNNHAVDSHDDLPKRSEHVQAALDMRREVDSIIAEHKKEQQEITQMSLELLTQLKEEIHALSEKRNEGHAEVKAAPVQAQPRKAAEELCSVTEMHEESPKSQRPLPIPSTREQQTNSGGPNDLMSDVMGLILNTMTSVIEPRIVDMSETNRTEDRKPDERLSKDTFMSSDLRDAIERHHDQRHNTVRSTERLSPQRIPFVGGKRSKDKQNDDVQEIAEGTGRSSRECAKLAQHEVQTELDVYEQQEQLQGEDDRARRWHNGFMNCPELVRMQEDASRHQPDCLDSAYRGIWSWLPIYGFDGMEKARRIPLFVPRATEDVDSEHSQSQFSPQDIVDAVVARETDHSIRAAMQVERHGDANDQPIDTKSHSPSSIQPAQHMARTEQQSIISQLTRTQSRILPDGSVETRRVLRKRFSDGREESEESTEITPARKNESDEQFKPGWFWN